MNGTPPLEVHPQFAAGGDSFAHLVLGKRPPKVDGRTLQLARYLRPDALPQIPASYDATADVTSWPMYGNDRLGDCTCAAAGHMVQSWSAAAGAPKTPADSDVEGLYWATGSGDDGRFELDVLNYWRHVGFGGDQIGAYVAVDPQDLAQTRAAVWLFGGVYLGIALPVTAQSQSVWDVNGDPSDQNGPAYPGSWGGHAVPVLAFDTNPVDDESQFTLVTWGGLLKMTARFFKTYCDEQYAILSPDWLASGKSPMGFDTAALTDDLNALAHQQQ